MSIGYDTKIARFVVLPPFINTIYFSYCLLSPQIIKLPHSLSLHQVHINENPEEADYIFDKKVSSE